MVPVEVKAGASGTLKSLHTFMAERKLPLTLRLNAAPPQAQTVDVAMGKGGRAHYHLLSLPLYLTEEAPRLLEETFGLNLSGK